MTYTLNAPQIDTPPLSQMITGNTCHTPEHVVGNTPVLWVPEIASGQRRGFWAKLEGHNPGGIKDRPALHMVERARERGRAAARRAASSSPPAAPSAWAWRWPASPTATRSPSSPTRAWNRSCTGCSPAYGARSSSSTEPHPAGGWQQARRTGSRELLREHPDAWCPDQYNNPDNVAAYAPLAHELVAQLGRIDVLVVQRGHRRPLRRHLPRPARLLSPTCGSSAWTRSARPSSASPRATRLMRGLGSSIHPRNVAYELFDEVHWVAAARGGVGLPPPGPRHYATGGWSVGAVALVARWLARTLPAEARGSPRSSPTARTATSTRSSTTTTAASMICSAARPPTDPDEIAHPGEREVDPLDALHHRDRPARRPRPPAARREPPGEEPAGPDPLLRPAARSC